MSVVASKKVCCWCRLPLTRIAGVWIHEGGTLYVQTCSACPYEGPEPASGDCPGCGSRGTMRDQHVALAVAEGDLHVTRAAVEASS